MGLYTCYPIHMKLVDKRIHAKEVINAWRLLFGTELKEGDAVWLVGKMGCSGEVIMAAKKAREKNIEYPLSYIKAGIKKKNKKPEPRQEEEFDVEKFYEELDQLIMKLEEMEVWDRQVNI